MESLFFVAVALVLFIWRHLIAQTIFDLQRPWLHMLFGWVLNIDRPWFRRMYDWSVAGMIVVLLWMAYAAHFGPIQLSIYQ